MSTVSRFRVSRFAKNRPELQGTARSLVYRFSCLGAPRKEQDERRRQEAAILRLRRIWRKRRATNYSFDNDQALVKATSRTVTRARARSFAISLARTRFAQSSNDVSAIVKFHAAERGMQNARYKVVTLTVYIIKDNQHCPG